MLPRQRGPRDRTHPRDERAMTLTEYLTEDRIVIDVRNEDVRGILGQLLAPAIRSGSLEHPEVALAALLAREKVLSTGIGHGIAIPHAISSSIPEPQVLVGICAGGADYESMDGEPVHVFFVLLSPPDRASHHTRLLARIARLGRDPAFVESLRACDDPASALEQIAR